MKGGNNDTASNASGTKEGFRVCFHCSNISCVFARARICCQPQEPPSSGQVLDGQSGGTARKRGLSSSIITSRCHLRFMGMRYLYVHWRVGSCLNDRYHGRRYTLQMKQLLPIVVTLVVRVKKWRWEPVSRSVRSAVRIYHCSESGHLAICGRIPLQDPLDHNSLITGLGVLPA